MRLRDFKVSVVFIVLAIKPFLVSAKPATEGSEVSQLVIFLGHLHPLVVHLPIGFITLWLILEALVIFKKRTIPLYIFTLLIQLTCISSIVSVVFGYLLSLSGGYEEEILDEHMYFGFALTGVVVFVYFLITFFHNAKFYKLIYNGCLFAIVFLLFATGHHGGALTHGSEYLSLRWTDKAGPTKDGINVKNISEAVVYRDIIQPIFNKRCISCHNPEKKKGELLLISFEDLMKGGKEGQVIVPHEINKSELFRVINLPSSEEEAMPPKGKVPLSNDEIQLIGWWIENGASVDMTVGKMNTSATVKNILSRFSNVSNKSAIADIKVDAVPEADISSALKAGFTVLPVSQDNNLLQVSLTATFKDSLNSKKISTLKKIQSSIAWLDLHGTNFSDSLSDLLTEMKYLNSLYLQNTSAGDVTLSKLKNLKYLERLNIYNSKVTNAGLKNLENIPSLRSLSLWKTKVTSLGVGALRKKIPQLTVYFEKNLSSEEKYRLTLDSLDNADKYLSDKNKWDKIEMPSQGKHTPLKDFKGIAWLRKEIQIDESAARSSATLYLCEISDNDHIWMNEKYINGTVDDKNKFRGYSLKPSDFKVGKNVILIRIVDLGEGEGMNCRYGDMKVEFSKDKIIPLRGIWEYKLSITKDKFPAKFP